MTLDLDGIKALLPHREPMLMLDSVTELHPGKTVTAEKHISPEWDVLSGHFPEAPVTPGVYIAEAMAQAADVIILSLPVNAGKMPLFLGINRLRFLRPVKPDSTMRIEAKLTGGTGDIYEFSAAVFVGENKAASGQVTIALR